MAKVVIAGCGFAGLATGRAFLAAGWEVVGLTHSEESAAELRGEDFPVLGCDITDRERLSALPEVKGAEVVIHAASSGRGGAEQYRAVYLGGAKALAEVMQPRVIVFTSSTSVYAQTDGSWVSEESEANPDRETGQILRETEEFVIGCGGIVARLGGIYGPGRSVLLRKFLAGEAVIEGDGFKWLNQIHREDIASGLLHLVTVKAGGIFNLSDDQPLEQRAVYEFLAERFKREMPPRGAIDLNRKRGWTNKRVSNAKLRLSGWVAGYASFLDAVVRDGDLVGSEIS